MALRFFKGVLHPSFHLIQGTSFACFGNSLVSDPLSNRNNYISVKNSYRAININWLIQDPIDCQGVLTWLFISQLIGISL